MRQVLNIATYVTKSAFIVDKETVENEEQYISLTIIQLDPRHFALALLGGSYCLLLFILSLLSERNKVLQVGRV